MIDFGHGVILTTIDLSCKELIRDFRNDYKIWKWCRQNDLISEDHHSKWMGALEGRSDVKMYAITSGTGWIAGVCGLTDIDRVNQRAEFSLYIASEHQGKGLGKYALKTLLSHGFMNQNLNVIWGETFEGNPAYDVFLKLGMKHDGTRRQFYFKEGRFTDAHLVSMTYLEFMEAPWRQAQQ